MAVLIFIPWLMFAMLSTLFAIAYHHHALAVLLVALVWVMLAIIFMVLDARQRMAGSWFLFLGVLCLIAIILGCMCGAYNYWTNMFLYWSYDEHDYYTNVLTP